MENSRIQSIPVSGWGFRDDRTRFFWWKIVIYNGSKGTWSRHNFEGVAGWVR